MPSKQRRKSRPRGQCAALPFKKEGDETLVMLVTSRETGRWVLPKGWAEKQMSGARLAAKEAFEEAGIIGATASKPIGRYRYSKRMPGGKTTECIVRVFPMRVDGLLDTWPEAAQRKREWFSVADAARHVEEAELVSLLLRLTAHEH